MPQKQVVRVNEPSDAYKAMVPAWSLVDALHMGTRGMREQSTEYLPKEDRESSASYKARLERSILFPGLKKAIKNLTGKAFASSVSFKEGTLNTQWEEWFKNVDLAGKPLAQFAQDVFLSGLKYGHTSIVADYPKVPAGATLYEERQRIKARPYLVHREAKSVIGWRTSTVNNEEKLSRVRIRETVTAYQDQWDDDGAAIQVRVLEPGMYQLWRENEDGDWILVEQAAVSIVDRIPITPIYFGHEGVFQSKPPLEDLGWTNVAHWQSYSDQRTILRIARVPFMLVKGADKDEIGDSISIGISQYTALRNPNADIKYVEHSGASINAGRQDCIDLEERMFIQAAEPLMSRPGSDTATGRVLDAREATSPLAAWVSSFEHGINEAFKAMAEFAGTDAAPEAQMSRDFGIIGQTTDLDALMKARAMGEISRDAFLAELKRRGVLGEMFDAESDAEKIEEEEPADPEEGGFGEGDDVRKGEGDNAGGA